MRGLVRTLLLTLAGAVAFGAKGDASQPQQPAPPAATPAPAAAPAPRPTPAEDIEDFVPSEKVGADDAVTFPTDI